MRATHQRTWLAALALAGLTLLAYLPALHGGFIWDDNNFLTDNPLIHASDGLRRFWLTREAPDYWPVSSSTLWVEWRWWGLHAAGYHATNLALHLASVLLLWRILERLRIPGAYWGALIFALHPVNVESVAWITQRKNLMAMLGFLAAIRCFVQSERGNFGGARSPSAPARTARGLRWEIMSLGCFLFALLSKGSVIPLPIVLAGIIAWQRPLKGRDWLRLAPFFALAALFALINLQFQAHDYGTFRTVTGLQRLLGAAAAGWFYLGKAVWPVRLSLVYPNWQVDPQQLRWWLPLAGALAVTLLLWFGRPRTRAAWFAWAYFAVMLAPALGFTDVGFMKFSLVSDHYQHLALIGPAVFVGAAFAAGLGRLASSIRPTLLGLGVIGLVCLGVLSWRQNEIFADPERLYRTALERNPASSLAHNNLAILLSDRPGKDEEAIREYQAALRADPTMAEAHFNLGNLYLQKRRDAAAALAEYETALRLNPHLAVVHNNLGRLLISVPSRRAEAIAHFETALQISPRYFAAQLNLANALAQMPDGGVQSVAHYEAALRLDPQSAEAENNLANVLASLPGRAAESVPHYRAALKLRPDLGQIHSNFADVLAQQPGGRPEARAEYQRALQLDPSLDRARSGLLALRASP